MLADKDRIFTNLYGFHDWRLAGAARAAPGTTPRRSSTRGPTAIVEEMKKSGLRGRGGAGFPTGSSGPSCPRR
jgi:NADH-quinone oxidoreductase subunit F